MCGGSSPDRPRDVMRSYLTLRAELVRMQNALALTRRRRARVLEQIQVPTDDAVVVIIDPKGRTMLAWSAADHLGLQALQRRCAGPHAGELAALDRKIARQEAAVSAFLRKHRFNDPLADLEEAEREVRVG